MLNLKKSVFLILGLALCATVTTAQPTNQNPAKDLDSWIAKGTTVATAAHPSSIVKKLQDLSHPDLTLDLPSIGFPSEIPNESKLVLFTTSHNTKGQIQTANVGMKLPIDWRFHDIAAFQNSSVQNANPFNFFDDEFGFRTFEIGKGTIISAWPKPKSLKRFQNKLVSIVLKSDADLTTGFLIDKGYKTKESLNGILRSTNLPKGLERDFLAALKDLHMVTFHLWIGKESKLLARFHFRQGANITKERAEGIMKQILGSWKLEFPGSDRWETQIDSKKVSFAFTIRPEALPLIGSSFFPTQNQQQYQTPGFQVKSETESGVDQKKTKRIVLAIDRVIKKLGRLRSKNKPLLLVAHLLEKEAESLRRRNYDRVHPEVIKYAESIHTCFRGLSASMQGQHIKIDSLNRSITINVTQTKGGWVWGTGLNPATRGVPTIRGGQAPEKRIETNLAETRKAQAEVVIKSLDDRRWIWEEIWKKQREIRTTLQKEFGENFIRSEPKK